MTDPKNKLFNMRVTEKWLEERREKMEKSTGFSSLADYVQSMIELGEGVAATVIRREVSEDGTQEDNL